MSREELRPLTEKSLFKVACKISGLYMLIHGISSLTWAFAARRFSSRELPFNPTEATGWFYGAVYTFVGFFLCARSSWITRVLFRMDSV